MAPFFLMESLLPAPGAIGLAIPLVGCFVIYPPRSLFREYRARRDEVVLKEFGARCEEMVVKDFVRGYEGHRRRDEESQWVKDLRAGRADQMRIALERKLPAHLALLRDDGVWEIVNRESNNVDRQITWREALLELDRL